MTTKAELDARIEGLEGERQSFLSTYATLMDVWETERVPMAKQRASEALAEAQKRAEKIAELKKQRDAL